MSHKKSYRREQGGDGKEQNDKLTGNYRDYITSPTEEQAYHFLDMARPGSPDFLQNYSRFLDLIGTVQDGQ